ncbi:MAG: hypothetical protein WBC11_06650, partial [Dehalococcoidia bacterium]
PGEVKGDRFHGLKGYHRGIGTLLEWKQNERDNGTYVIARSTSDEAISEIEPRRKPRDCFATLAMIFNDVVIRTIAQQNSEG